MQNLRKILSLVVLISVFGLNSGLSMAQEIQSDATLNVTGLEVTETQSNSISLEWTEITTADLYVVEYGKTPVVEPTDKYELSKESTTNQVIIDDLEPNIDYYFSVVAFANNRSSVSSAYSDEVNAKTLNSEISIEKIEVTGAGSIKVTFSEELTLPAQPNQAVSISLLNTPTSTLGVTNVQKDTVNPNVLIINTQAQSPDARYIIEFSEAFVSSDNTLISETSRTDSFIGYNAASSNTTTSAMTGLKAETIKAMVINDKFVVEIDFNQAITLDNNSISKFKIVESNNPNNFLNIVDIKPNLQDDSKYLFVTDNQKEIKYTLIMTGVTSNTNQSISTENSILEFDGAKAENNIPVNSQTELQNLKLELTNNVATLKWTKPAADSTIESINIYRSVDSGKNFTLLSKDVDPNSESKVLTGVTAGNNVQIKVTTLSGETESNRQVLLFQISETGPENVLFLAAILSIAYVALSKRKNLQSLLNQSF